MRTSRVINPFTWFRHGDLTDAVNSYRTLTTVPALVTDGIPVPPWGREQATCLRITHLRAAGATPWQFVITIYGYRPECLIETPVGTFTAIAGVTGAGWSSLGEITVDGAGANTLKEDHLLSSVSGYTRIAAQESSTPLGDPNIWTDLGFAEPDHAEEV